MKRRLIIIGITILLIAVAGDLSHRASNGHDSAGLDATSSASEVEEETVEEWNFAYKDYGLSEKDEDYREMKLEGDSENYHLLWNNSKAEQDSHTLLVNKQGKDVHKEAKEAARLLEAEGYTVTIKECSETMFASRVHAKKFDIVYMGKESR